MSRRYRGYFESEDLLEDEEVLDEEIEETEEPMEEEFEEGSEELEEDESGEASEDELEAESAELSGDLDNEVEDVEEEMDADDFGRNEYGYGQPEEPYWDVETISDEAEAELNALSEEIADEISEDDNVTTTMTNDSFISLPNEDGDIVIESAPAEDVDLIDDEFEHAHYDSEDFDAWGSEEGEEDELSDDFEGDEDFDGSNLSEEDLEDEEF